MFNTVLCFFRDLIINDPVPLKKDTKIGFGVWWWTKAVIRAALCCLTFYSPFEYIRECRSRKIWWDSRTDGQRHWHIEEQGRLMENMIGSLDSLLDSLAKGDPKLERKTKKLKEKRRSPT